MAILYKANETDFSHLGLGPLNDAISILVTEERNGIFELEMKYPVSGKLFNELKNDRLIKADAGHNLKDQRFKIIRITKPLKGIVTVYAEHVSYLTQDLALKPKVTFTGNARQALEHWKANLVDDNPFTVWSDISTTGKINWTIDEVENARRALGGVQGSILDVYGGEYLFDNYDIYLYQKRGVNSELLIAYGRNLVDLEQEEEIANTYTSIYPYSIYTDDDGNERMVTLPEYYIDSEHVDKYARRKILVVDFTTDEIETVSALRNAARRYIKDNDVGVPRVNLKIQYVDLAKTLDYKDLALYEEVNLCDNVMIYFEKYDINTTAKVIKVVWDVLNERYDSIEVGEARASLSQAIDTVVDGKVHNVEKLAMQTLRTADGKNTIYFGLEEPLATQYPLKKNDIWYRIVDGEFTRTYIYDGVVWQLVIDMDSQEAKEQAQQARDRADDAVNRANQATQTANTAIGQAQASFDLAQESLTLGQGLTSRMTDAEGNLTALNQTTQSLAGQLSDVEGNITTLTATVDGLQTTVSDVQGNVSNLTQLSNTLQTRLSDAEGNINELTLTSQSMQSTISSLQDDWDNLEIGEINLILKSNQSATSTTYLVKEYFISEDFIPGEEYTVVIKGNINSGQVFGLWQNVGSSRRGFFEDIGNGLFTLTFSSAVTTSGNERRVRIYNYPSSGASSATIEWIKLVKANKTSLSWSPAPEDMATQSQITQLSDAINLRVAKGDVINQINIDTSGVLISGKKLILDGDTTVLGTFKLDGSAHIKDASIGTAQIGTIDAAIANIVNISANSIVGGILSSQNDNMTLNMNTGRLHMENVDFTLGNGADIEFLNRGNKLYYKLKDSETNLIRSAGLIFGTSINDRFPLVGMGISNGSRPGATDADRWTGFLVNARGRRNVDGIGNSVVGLKFDVRDEAINYSKGFTFELSGNPTFRGINAHNYNYYLGNSDFLFHRLYVRGINTVGNFVIRNVVNTGIGWRLSTIQESGRVSLRGINGGSYNYDLGASESYNHFHFGYINNLRGSGSSSVGSSSNPYTYGHIDTLTVHKNFWNNSLREYKENIVDLNLETAIEFVRDNKVKVFNYKGSNDKTVGLIRDDLVGDVSLVATETAISPTSVQYINQKVLQHVLKETDDIKDEVNRLKIENQYLKQKVKQLEEMVA